MNVYSKLSKHERTVLACAEVAKQDKSTGTYICDVLEKRAARMLERRGLVTIKKPKQIKRGEIVFWVVTLRDISNAQVETSLKGCAP